VVAVGQRPQRLAQAQRLGTAVLAATKAARLQPGAPARVVGPGVAPARVEIPERVGERLGEREPAGRRVAPGRLWAGVEVLAQTSDRLYSG
jgi:hypothetical protein